MEFLAEVLQGATPNIDEFVAELGDLRSIAEGIAFPC